MRITRCYELENFQHAGTWRLLDNYAKQKIVLQKRKYVCLTAKSRLE